MNTISEYQSVVLNMEIIIGAFCFSYYFVNIANIPNWIKSKMNVPMHHRIKPIDCASCLSVYVAAILLFIPYSYSHFIFVTFTAGTITAYLSNIMEKQS